MDNKSNTFYLLILLTVILFFIGAKIINKKMLPIASDNINESDNYSDQYKVIEGEKYYILKKEYNPYYEFYDECPGGLKYEDLLNSDFRWEVFR